MRPSGKGGENIIGDIVNRELIINQSDLEIQSLARPWEFYEMVWIVRLVWLHDRMIEWRLIGRVSKIPWQHMTCRTRILYHNHLAEV